MLAPIGISLCPPPNPRLQRTRWRSPLSRQPLGIRESPAAESRGYDYGTVREHGKVESVGESELKSESVSEEQLRVSMRLESPVGGQHGAVPNTALQRTSPAAPVPPLSATPLGGSKS